MVFAFNHIHIAWVDIWWKVKDTLAIFGSIRFRRRGEYDTMLTKHKWTCDKNGEKKCNDNEKRYAYISVETLCLGNMDEHEIILSGQCSTFGEF